MASISSSSGAVAELVEAPRRIPAIPRLLRANPRTRFAHGHEAAQTGWKPVLP